MAKIKVTNPKQIINGGAKKYYFKVKGVGGIKGDKGDKGDTGSQGPQGPQGNAATIEVGSTTTLPTGYDATVTNTGTINNAILNFGIPRGIKGDTGAKGDKGDKGDKGEQGNTGPQGPAGQNATVYVGTTTTGAAGTQASVYNSGTDRNAVLNFTIPQGAKGDTGATGATGPQGPAGQDGQNFTPTVVDSLPATGDQSKLYLTPKNYTTGTATGNPITISLGEDAGQITSAQLDGDTSQQTYTGKNLAAPYNAPTNPLTVNGITCTWNAEEQTMTFNGTAEAANTTFMFIGKDIELIAGTTNVCAYYVSGSRTGYCKMRCFNSSYDGYVLDLADLSNSNTMVKVENNNRTFTLDCTRSNIRFDAGSTATNFKIKLMIANSNDTTYEPYVGGQPSPNPDYPQPIQTVTGLQTVEIVGRNLFDKNDVVNGIPSASDGTIVSTTSIGRTSRFIRVKSSTSYSHTGHPNGWATIAWYKADKSFISRTDNATTTTSPTEAAFARVSCASTDLNTCQFEEGQPTTYTPYHATSYPISLGSIELCKLGTYQDYIYKSGDDWKVHKATNKAILDSSSFGGWTLTTGATGYTRADTASRIGFPSYDGYCDKLTTRTGAHGEYEYIWFQPEATGRIYIQVMTSRLSDNTIEGFNSWLNDAKPTAYYTLSTPTDATITDTNLIAQLEAIRTTSLQASNTITNTATGSNLAGDLELGYCEYDPQNRYDKWLWLDLNNNYEKVGEGSSEWLNGTIYTGYKPATNTAYPNGIQYRICGGFLCVRFGVSASSGNLASGEQSVGELPEELQGHNIKILSSPDNRTMVRGFMSCGGGISGFFQINKGVIVIAPNSSTGWASGQIQIPLED